jgi:hypothetical protein
MSGTSLNSDTDTNNWKAYNPARCDWTSEGIMLDSSTTTTSTMGHSGNLGISPEGKTPKMSVPFALDSWLNETQSLDARLYLWGDEEEVRDGDEATEVIKLEATPLEGHGSRECSLSCTAPARRPPDSGLESRLDVNLLGIGAWVDG